MVRCLLAQLAERPELQGYRDPLLIGLIMGITGRATCCIVADRFVHHSKRRRIEDVVLQQSVKLVTGVGITSHRINGLFERDVFVTHDSHLLNDAEICGSIWSSG